ncbi:MAG: SpoIIE family protein phosphatase [Gammaproteobacteria bacterium]|nr:SpoIIE family protein phosphatase [Gammaproteobacteria bacterium]
MTLICLKRIKYSVVVEALSGEVACGDQYLITELPDATLFAVVDGLGHGERAELAAKKAIEVIKENAHQPIEQLFRLCNDALDKTRGVAMTIVRIDDNYKINYKAVGNVSGVWWHIGEKAKLSSQSFYLENGIVGTPLAQLTPSKEMVLAAGDTLILASDGISKEFENLAPKWGTVDNIAKEIFTTYRNKKDDGIVLVVQLL